MCAFSSLCDFLLWELGKGLNWGCSLRRRGSLACSISGALIWPHLQRNQVQRRERSLAANYCCRYSTNSGYFFIEEANKCGGRSAWKALFPLLIKKTPTDTCGQVGLSKTGGKWRGIKGTEMTQKGQFKTMCSK